jgi:pimeloyl-ACP methyl ester carboxylesterase
MTKPTVVLLHASTSSGAQWRSLSARLESRFSVHAPDLCGYGATAGWNGRGEFTLEREALAVRELIERSGAPVHLVGHSYGGAVALGIARRWPGVLRSLTLIEPVAFHVLRAGDQTDAAALGEICEVAYAVSRALANGDYEGGCRRFIDYWTGEGAWAAMPEGKRDALAARLPKVALDFHAALGDPALPRDLRSMKVRTLLLQGSSTTLAAGRVCEVLALALPAARLERIQGAGHMLPLTHTEQVNALIAAHIEEEGNEAEEDRVVLDFTARGGLLQHAGA